MLKLNVILAGLMLPLVGGLSAAQQSGEDQQLQNALTLYQQQKYSEAATLFSDLHTRAPRQVVYLNNLAAAQMALGDVEQALQTLQQAMATSENYTIAQKNINELYAYKASLAYAKALDKNDSGKMPQLTLVTVLESGVAENKAPVEAPTDIQPAVSEPDITQQLTELTASWATAWMQGDVDGYLGVYAADFYPDGKTSHEEWVNQRRYRLRNSKQVQVNYTQLNVFVASDQQSAIVEFVQFYQSGSYQDKVRKQLQWKFEAGHWRINKETVIENL